MKKEEKLALKDIKTWEDKVIQVQDKGSRFVVLKSNNYVKKWNSKKVEVLLINLILTEFKQKVMDWLDKWSDKTKKKKKIGKYLVNLTTAMLLKCMKLRGLTKLIIPLL